MPKRTRYDDEFAFTPDSFSLFPTADTLGLSDCDNTWVFETDENPTQLQFSDFGPTDIDIPPLQPLPSSDSRTHTETNANLLAGQDLSSGYQTSNGSSLSIPTSQATSAQSGLFLWSSPSSSSSSPRFPVAAESQPHTGEVNLCKSLCWSETCLTAALRILKTLHVAHSACLSAHQDGLAVPQARKMETVLSTNKDVVASVAQILACFCSGKSLVQLLLLSICGNLIAWNSAMISAELEPGDPFSSACSSSTGSAQAPRARVLPQPISIGQHQISGKLGRTLHAQVMAGELRILEGLIDALSRRFSEASRSDSASSASSPTHTRNVNGRAATSWDTSSLQSKSLSNVVHRHIISSLHTRLQNTRAMIFSGLGQAG